MKDNDIKHKIWFIMDSNLILPEYFVEFDYIMINNLKAEYLLVESSGKFRIGTGIILNLIRLFLVCNGRRRRGNN